MPFIGTLGNAGGYAFGANNPKPYDLELIEKVILSTTATSITLNEIPARYENLKLHIRVRGGSGVTEQLAINYNNDSSSSYLWGMFGAISGTGNTAFNNNLFSTYGYLHLIPGNGSTTGVFSGGEVDILNYAQIGYSKYSLFQTTSYNSTTTFVDSVFGGMAWTGSGAIDTITLSTVGGSGFVSGSSVSLYGMAG